MFLNSLKNFFKVPAYLEMPMVGIDIGEKFVRFVEIKSSKNGPVLSKYGEVELPEGVFSGGDILKKSELVAILKKIKKENDFNLVKVSVSEDKSYIFNAEIPKLNKKEARSMLEFKIEENVPLKLEEAVFEYSVIRRPREENSKSSEMFVSVSVVPQMTINAYLDLFKEAGLTPVSFQIESQAVLSSVVDTEDRGAVFLIDVKEKKTVLSIAVNGAIWFSSTIAVGSDSLLSKIKSGRTNKIPDSYLNVDDEKGAELFSASINIFSVIRDEAIKFHQFFKTHKDNPFGGAGVSHVVLSGRACAMPGFVRYIGASMQTDISLANVWTNVFSLEDIMPGMHLFDSLDYATAIGVAINK